MTSTIIISLCILILIAYIFDVTSSKTSIPSVILLLLLGFGAQELIVYSNINLPDLNPLLPGLGTIGLILIVLEGSLELELSKSKIPTIKRSFISALLPLVMLGILLGFYFANTEQASLKDGISNALPFCIISSAIAIPSVKYLSEAKKEFVIYESSLSDIFGVILFNFFTFNEIINLFSVTHFIAQILIMAVIAIISTGLLSLLLSKINHHVKFVPITLLVILIYEISKIYDLPALIFILVFGLAAGNLDKLKGIKSIRYLKVEEMRPEIIRFRDLITEFTFLVRTLFFLLFGFLMEKSTILNTKTIIPAFAIVILIYLLRAIQLKILKIEFNPILFIAPRGLITILLFISIPKTQSIWFVNDSLIIQVIILSTITMMLGFMFQKKQTGHPQI